MVLRLAKKGTKVVEEGASVQRHGNGLRAMSASICKVRMVFFICKHCPADQSDSGSPIVEAIAGGGAPGDLGVLQLRLFLRNKGLGQAGNKEELVQRIQQHVSDHLKESKEAQNKVEPSATPVKLGQLSDADAFKQLEGGICLSFLLPCGLQVFQPSISCANLSGSGDPKDLNVRQLKAFLRVKGLKESGNKTELVERVRQFLKGGNEDGAEGDDEEEEDEGEEDEEEEGEEEGDDDEEGEEDEEGEGEEQEQEQVQAEVAVVKTKPPKSRVNTKDFDDDQVHQYVQGFLLRSPGHPSKLLGWPGRPAIRLLIKVPMHLIVVSV